MTDKTHRRGGDMKWVDRLFFAMAASFVGGLVLMVYFAVTGGLGD